MTRILAIAPHPDDETLGCGGAILRHRSEGDEVHWLIVTAISEDGGYTKSEVEQRDAEISAVGDAFGFASVHQLRQETARLDTLALDDLIGDIAAVVSEIGAETLYVPFPGDVHSDHRVVFDAAAACTKTFRFPTVRRVLAVENLSGTDFSIDPTIVPFHPNSFIDISEYLDEKIRIMNLYAGEVGPFPFPRSEDAIRALAMRRGVQAGCEAAEAFMILKEIV